jgi:ribosomal protein S18 acetylase RimI-like enzyme
LNALASPLQHGIAEVHPGDGRLSCRRMRDSHATGPCRDVENRVRAMDGESTHKLAAPARVLPERQDLGQGVIAPRQPAEELDGKRVVSEPVLHSRFSLRWPTVRRKLRTPLTGQLNEDAKRFQAWQLAALDAHPAGTELLSFGPFRAVIPDPRQPGAWVTMVEGPVDRDETNRAIAGLRTVFKQRGTELEIEYNEALFPQMGGWLEAAGLAFGERNPLMACRPEGFKPFAAPDVTVRRLTTASEAVDLESFQTIRWTNGGDNGEAVPPVEQLRKALLSLSSVYLLAWLDGERAGTGVSHSLQGAAEIVGVVTRADMRRRGVAATVTSELVARQIAESGDFVFLDAANQEAARVYERLGFNRFGDNVVYRGHP